MSEYLIIVALIAVAGIAVMGFFGSTARNQVAGLAAELSGGDATSAISSAQSRAGSAFSDSTTNISLGNYSGRNSALTGG